MESNAWCPRLTAAMILSGSAVHVKGFGSALVSARKRLMAAWRSTTERKTPRFKRRLDSLAKKPSTALSQEHEVGVKWKTKRSCRSSQARTLGCERFSGVRRMKNGPYVGFVLGDRLILESSELRRLRVRRLKSNNSPSFIACV